VSPIADTTTTTSLPCFLVSTMRSATRRIRSASDTEDPPYFCTTSATVSLPRWRFKSTTGYVAAHLDFPWPSVGPMYANWTELVHRAHARRLGRVLAQAAIAVEFCLVQRVLLLGRRDGV